LRGIELVSEPVESERWLRRGEETYFLYVDDPRRSQREAIGRL
jgi:hypothetical protein